MITGKIPHHLIFEFPLSFLIFNLSLTHLPRNEARQAHINVLAVGHLQQGESGVQGTQNVVVVGEGVAGALGLAPRQLRPNLENEV